MKNKIKDKSIITAKIKWGNGLVPGIGYVYNKGKDVGFSFSTGGVCNIAISELKDVNVVKL